MDRERAREVALPVLATVAVALTAAVAVPMFAQTQGDESAADATVNPGNRDTPGSSDINFPTDLLLLAIAVAAAVGIVVQFSREPWETLTLVARLGVVGVGFVAVMSFLYQRLSIDYFVPEGGQNISAGRPNFTETPTPGGGFGEGSNEPLSIPDESAVFLVLAAGAFGLGAFLVWRSGTARSLLGFERDDADDDGEDLGGVGRVAGEAAERVDAAATPETADNAIYGAWRDMLTYLGADDPQSATPRQFADAAIEAGMDPDDVSILTRAFEDVRYGDAALSDARRERVTAAFRRIEAAHGDESPGSTGRGRERRGTGRDGAESGGGTP